MHNCAEYKVNELLSSWVLDYKSRDQSDGIMITAHETTNRLVPVGNRVLAYIKIVLYLLGNEVSMKTFSE